MTVPTTCDMVDAVNLVINSLIHLDNVLARIEVDNTGPEEIVMLTCDGFVAGCAADNVVIVQKGKLFTPPPGAHALHGTKRNAAPACARESGFPTGEPDLSSTTSTSRTIGPSPAPRPR